MNEENYKLVEYEKWCKTCKHKDLETQPGKDIPCDECLDEPARQYSHKPLRYEEK